MGGFFYNGLRNKRSTLECCIYSRYEHKNIAIISAEIEGRDANGTRQESCKGKFKIVSAPMLQYEWRL